MKRTIIFISVLSCLTCVPFNSIAATYYVDDDADSGGDGSDWDHAHKYLQDALASVSDGDTILIAQGIYKPDQGGGKTPGDREASFLIMKDVEIYGRYAGIGAPDPDERDTTLYETVLSGDLANNDVNVTRPIDLLFDPALSSRSENSYQVVYVHWTAYEGTLDGLTVSGGNADDYAGGHGEGGAMEIKSDGAIVNDCIFSYNSAEQYGGAVYTSFDPILKNCTFHCNISKYGGGMHISSSSKAALVNCTFNNNRSQYFGGGVGITGDGNVKLTGCTFSDNTAKFAGGGMYTMFTYDNSPKIDRCIFIQNNAWSDGGAACSFWDSEPLFTNCVFSGNSAHTILDWPEYHRKGGAVSNRGGKPTLINCTFSGNYGTEGANCLFNRESSGPTLINCILWDGGQEISNWDDSAATITYSVVQGGWPGEGNITTDPLLVDPGHWDGSPGEGTWVEGDYHLQAGSPCIDAGYPFAAVGEYDVDGNPRYLDASVTSGWDGTIKTIRKSEGGGVSLLWKFIDMGSYEYQPSGVLYNNFSLQSSDALDASNWQEMYTGPAGTWTDTETTGADKRFYRVYGE